MSDKLRCAVIGAGAIGLQHLTSLSNCPHAISIAVAENSPERAREAGDRFRIARRYDDYRELLEQPDVDAVTIALPNFLHARVAVEALEAGKHVMLEKPMATTAAEAELIIETARKMKRTIMVGHHFRFNKFTQMVKQVITRGDVGELYHARGFWYRRSGIPRIGSWFTQKELAGGGCTIDLGVHILDACLYLMNDFDVASVSAQTHTRFGNRGLGEFEWGKSEIATGRPFDVDDFSAALLKFRNGHSMIMEISWASFMQPEGRDYGMDIIGTEGGVSLFPAKWHRNHADGNETITLNASKLPLPEDRIHHFVRCVIDGTTPAVDPKESFQVQRILQAIYESSSSGAEILLPALPDPNRPEK